MRGTSPRAAEYLRQGLLALIRRKGALYGPEVVVAYAVPWEFGLLVIHCPFCGQEHRHGPGFGTRYPHCASGDSQYSLTPPVGLTDLDFPFPLEESA